MVDAQRSSAVVDSNAKASLDWLSTFKGFYNKLESQDADAAGRGSFAYGKALNPGEPVSRIPAASLSNPSTSAKSPSNSIPLELFPASASSDSPPRSPSSAVPRLTTTQLLALHLASTHDARGRHRSEWQIFLDSIETDFTPWHPLTWSSSKDDFWQTLESRLSRSVRVKIDAVRRRYDADLAVLKRVLTTVEPFKSQGVIDAIPENASLWAWSNVNTRTVAMPLGLSEPADAKWPVNNHSFIPSLDMINHSSSQEFNCPKPEPIPSATSNGKSYYRGGKPPVGKSQPGKVDLMLFAPSRGLNENEEVKFLYGPHSNAMLFAEYGFTETHDDSEDGAGVFWPNGDVDVNPWVEAMWESQLGGTEEGERKRAFLEDEGMWGHNRSAANGGEPAPSTGSMLTLLVMVTPPEEFPTIVATSRHGGLKSRAFTRPSKQAAYRQLAGSCQDVSLEALESGKKVDKLAKTIRADDEDRNSKEIAVRSVRGSIREQESISRTILDVVESGAGIPGF